ncbi:MAG TPA: class I SAM-dependent methyltransferase [Methanoregulaceae archaeon]|nr:class I SAM-dependent methyltransferase [Methanoregulaceae archaeon]
MVPAQQQGVRVMPAEAHLCRYSPLTAFLLDNPVRMALLRPGAVLSGLVRPGMTVVDLGCGPGAVTRLLARMVGDAGRVIAVDIQEEMLACARRRCERAGYGSRVTWHRNLPGSLGIAGPVDVVLSFHMLHEVPDQARLLGDVHAVLRPQGRYLVVEPALHVPPAAFERTIGTAVRAGFTVEDRPRVPLGRAVLLAK